MRSRSTFSAARRADCRGITLIELIVTVAVLGVVTSLAAPSFAGLMAANRMSTRASEFIAALNLARSEAVRRAQAVELRGSDSDDYAKGWTIVAVADSTTLREAGALAGATTLRRMLRSAPPAPFSYRRSSLVDRMVLAFDAHGALSTGSAAYFQFCDSARPDLPGRVVQVNVVGKITLDNAAAACS